MRLFETAIVWTVMPNSFRYVVVALVCFAACGKGSSSETATPDPSGPITDKEVEQMKVDAEVQIARDKAQQSLPTIRAALANGKLTDASSPCDATLRHRTVLEKVEPATAKDVEQLCWHDVPVAMLKASITKLEAEKITPDTKARVCLHASSMDWLNATHTLADHNTADDESKALVARHDAICPT
jgi:hypothetical protein